MLKAINLASDRGISYRNLDSSSLAEFKNLNQVIFPVKYTERFYKDCSNSPSVLTRLAFCGPKLVGAVAARREAQPDGLEKLYIMTLGVYAPYRGREIGSRLLELALESVKGCSEVVECYLHVQISNVEAIDFYTKRGFAVSETVSHYYKRIQPPHAVVLRRFLS